MKHTKMSKVLAFVLALTLVMSTCACILTASAEGSPKTSVLDVPNTVAGANSPSATSGFDGVSINEEGAAYANSCEIKTISLENSGATNYTITYKSKLVNKAAGLVFGTDGTNFVMCQFNNNPSETNGAQLVYRPHTWVNNGASCLTTLDTGLTAEDAVSWNSIVVQVINNGGGNATMKVSINGIAMEDQTIPASVATLNVLGFRANQQAAEAACFQDIKVMNDDNDAVIYESDFGLPSVSELPGTCESDATFDWNTDGLTPDFWMEPGGSGATITFDVSGYTFNKFSGTIGFCSNAVADSMAVGDYIGIFADGMLMTSTKGLSAEEPFQNFDAVLPDGTQTVIVKVFNVDGNCHNDHVNFFNSYFEYDGSVAELDQDVLKVNTLISAATSVDTYKAGSSIDAALEAYETLSETQKAQVVGYDRLLEVQEAYDKLADDVNVTVTGWSSKNDRQEWLAGAEADEVYKQATLDAIADEIKYEYAKRAYKLGDLEATYTIDEWTIVYLAFGLRSLNSPENVASSGVYGGGAGVYSPYAGTAFAVYEYFIADQNWNEVAMSNTFTYNGKVYQVYNMYTKSRDVNGTSITRDASIKIGDTEKNNSFAYAYAMYNQTHKWEGLNVGIPVSAVQTDGDFLYQDFEGPDGAAKIVNTADRVAALDVADPASYVENTAYVLTDAAWDAAVTFAEVDTVAAVLTKTGLPTSDLVNGIQYFEYGFYQDGVFEEYGDENAYVKVVNKISNLPTAIDAQNAANAETLIAEARAEYDALDEAQQAKVTNYADLQAAEALLATYKTDLVAATDVIALIDAIPAEITAEDVEKVTSAREAYDKLTATQKAMVTNSADLTAAEVEVGNLQDKQAALEVIEMIAGLPSEEDVRAMDADALQAVLDTVQEIWDAYDALTFKQSNYVDDASYETLATIEDLVNELLHPTEEGLLGDLNNDGNLSVTDVVLLRKAILNGDTVSTVPLGDMNGDDSLSVTDVVLLRKAILNQG